MITPTVGRVIWYYPPGASHEDQPWPAWITYVVSDTEINVAGFTKNGFPFSEPSVFLHQDPDTYGNPGGGSWARWMPFQIGQAKAAEVKPPYETSETSGSGPIPPSGSPGIATNEEPQ